MSYILKFNNSASLEQIGNRLEAACTKDIQIDGELISGILRAVDDVFIQCLSAQKEERKGRVKYICISMLRVKLLSMEAVYRVDAYDANWYLDSSECFALWNTELLFKNFFDEITSIRTRLREMFIEEHDFKKLINEFIPKIHGLAVRVATDAVPAIKALPSYEKMFKSAGLQIAIGEYQDRLVVLHEESDDSESLSEMEEAIDALRGK